MVFTLLFKLNYLQWFLVGQFREVMHWTQCVNSIFRLKSYLYLQIFGSTRVRWQTRHDLPTCVWDTSSSACGVRTYRSHLERVSASLLNMPAWNRHLYLIWICLNTHFNTEGKRKERSGGRCTGIQNTNKECFLKKSRKWRHGFHCSSGV